MENYHLRVYSNEIGNKVFICSREKAFELIRKYKIRRFDLKRII